MANNKNQHFVPQAYLKAFGNGRAIDIFNLVNGGIRNAPIKGQCSKDYFYGEDLVVEKQLSQFEGEFISKIRDLGSSGYRPTTQDFSLFARFWLLQHLRTDAEVRRVTSMQEKMVEGASNSDEWTMPFREITKMCVRIATTAPETLIDDLKYCILVNKTDIPFVTSDDPAIHTNRLYLTRRGKFLLSPGVGSSGAILILPLNPRLCFLAFDPDTYTVDERNGFVNLKKSRDALAINQHQYLNCDSNIYFSDWKFLEKVKLHFASVSVNRRERITMNEGEIADKELIHFGNVLLEPTLWPSILRNRFKQTGYSNGSAAGFIRKARFNSAPEYGDFKKITF